MNNRSSAAQWFVFFIPVLLTGYFATQAMIDAELPIWTIVLMWALDPVCWFVFFLGLSEYYILWGQVGDNRMMAIFKGNRFARIALNSIMFAFLGGDGIDAWRLQPIKQVQGAPRVTKPRNIFERYGMFWIGIPGFVHVRPSNFNTNVIVERVSNEGGGAYNVRQVSCSHKEMTPHVFFAHGWETINAETLSPRTGANVEGHPSSGKLYIDIANNGQWLIENPYLFLFSTETDGIITKINSTILATDGEVLRNMTYEEVSRATSEEGGDMTDEQLAREPDITKLSYGQRLRKLLNKEPGEGVRSVRTYGVRLYDHDLFDHQPSDKKTAEKIRDVELARLGAEEEIEKGRGEGGRAKERGEGEGKGKQSILEGEAAGLKAIMEGLKEHPEVAISYFTSQGMAAAGGEGPQGTRPDVVAFGESGPMRTLDLSRDRTKGKTISKPKTTEEK